MRIKSFSFESEDWVLQKIDLQKVNLIVGTNGTGKSKTLNYLDWFRSNVWTGNLYIDGTWNVSWITDLNETLEYRLKLQAHEEEDLDFIVTEESLHLEGKIILKRENIESCFIFSEIKQEYDVFYPPNNKLALLSRRDIKEYPYIERIIDWSKSFYHLEFSSINKDNQHVVTESTYEQFPKLYSRLEEQYQRNILNNYNSVGFEISTIRYESRGNNNHYLVLRELGINKDIYQDELSQGMMRTLCLFIYIENLISKNKTATLLIDDLGEGLDYKRATELGKILFRLCKDNNIQLIATSNDSFLMNVVDIDYWNVLIREGNVVKAINKQNHPKLFEDFVYEGTSNFNFFSSSYLPSRL